MAASYRNIALLATPLLVLGSRVRIFSIHVENSNATKSYLQLYNAAAAADVTVGTTTPDKTLFVPPNGAMDFDWAQDTVKYGNGLVVAATTTADGSTAPGTGLLINLDYERM